LDPPYSSAKVFRKRATQTNMVTIEFSRNYTTKAKLTSAILRVDLRLVQDSDR